MGRTRYNLVERLSIILLLLDIMSVADQRGRNRRPPKI